MLVRRSLYVLLCAAIAFLFAACASLSSSFGLLWDLLWFLIVAPVLVLWLLARSVFFKSPQSAVYGIVLGLISFACLQNERALRTHTKWLLESRHQKQEFQERAVARPGELPHMEWDGWNAAGQDTSAFLVHDTSGSLHSTSAPERLAGIPCEVPLVFRLEKDWYSVVLYTNTTWDRCG